MSRVLCIGDLHEPVAHPGYLTFCKDLYREFKCDTVVFMGDVVDWHAISFHSKEPECPSPVDEYEQTKVRVRRWYRAFPKARVCIGNHDARPGRLAKTVGIPERILMRDFNEIWGTPSWVWDYSFVIDRVYYTHGSGKGGVHPAWNKSGKLSMSVALGHNHSRAGVKLRANPEQFFYAVDVGCGIDNDAFQFVYGRECDDKPLIAAAVILNGEPILRRMPMARGEKYHKSKFAKGEK